MENNQIMIPYQDIIVFGDSLSDVGNANIATNNTQFPSPPYNNGRATNGFTIVELMAEKIGLGGSVSTPSFLGGDNFAVGGAELGQGFSTLSAPNLGTQINVYLQNNTPQEGDLFFLFGGGNDIVFNAEVSPQIMVDNVVDHISTLFQAGADAFGVFNVPPIDASPFVNTLGANEVTKAIKLEYNTLLDSALHQLREDLAVTIYEFDTDGLFENIKIDPDGFGFTNLTDQVLDPQTLTPVGDPNEIFWWDNIHPTGRVNEIFSDTFSQQIITSALPLSPELSLVTAGSAENDNLDSALMDNGFTGNNQILFTGSGMDTIDISQVGSNSRIDTGSGDDIVFVGTNNRIILGDGDDKLFISTSGGGNRITGGEGADQFWLYTDEGAIPNNPNIISDFNPDEDVIGFLNTTLSLGSSDFSYSQDGSDVIITAFGQNVGILLNTTITDSNFVFA